MVPIDDYACNAISNAGRLGQITPPVNGETSTTCAQQAPPKKLATPAEAESLESAPAPAVNSSVPMHLTCTELGGGSAGGMLLNCTTGA